MRCSTVVLVQNHHHSTYNTFTSITDLGLHQLSPRISYNSPDVIGADWRCCRQLECRLQKQEVSELSEEFTQRLAALERKFQQSIRDKEQLLKQLEVGVLLLGSLSLQSINNINQNWYYLLILYWISLIRHVEIRKTKSIATRIVSSFFCIVLKLLLNETITVQWHVVTWVLSLKHGCPNTS